MGIFVKSGTPPEILSKLQDEILRALESPDTAQRLSKLGLAPAPQRAPEFAAFVKGSVGVWEKIVKATATAEAK
jgi:tripartite-type tricarboxylate transporter receptor subunit TctC